MKVEFREITKSPATFERSVIRLSVMPSAKCCSCASSDMFVTGTRPIEGLLGSENAILALEATATGGVEPPPRPIQTATPATADIDTTAVIANHRARWLRLLARALIRRGRG